MGLDVFIDQIKVCKEQIRKKREEIKKLEAELDSNVRYIEKRLLDAGVGAELTAYACDIRSEK